MDHQVPGAALAPDAESQRWVSDLSAAGDRRDLAVARLRDLLHRVARSEAARRAGTHGLHGRELDDLAEQAAHDAVVSVLRRLPDYEGRSRFTTWACKFAILETGQKVSRHQWRRGGVAPDDATWEQLPGRLSTQPAEVAEAAELVEAIRVVVTHRLTERQRHVFEALVVRGVPVDVLSVELGSSRGAIYKMMYDVRRTVREHLVAGGHLSEEEAG